jgi:putative SOS response-associated peptidase YedK
MKSRRCLIPADGFYEWRRTATARQPFCFEVNEGELFAFAGLWDGWRDPDGQWIKSCSILTTTPNAVTSPDNYDLWLDPGVDNVDALGDFLTPFDAGLMRSYPVSSRINHVQNDDADCTTPIELGESQHELFS